MLMGNQEDKQKVVFDGPYYPFESDDVAPFLEWKDYENDGLRFYDAPRIVWKMTVSGFSTERISITRNKEIPENSVEKPDEELLKGLFNHYVKPSKCNYLYLDANGLPIFFGDKQSLACVEEHLYDTLPKISIENLQELCKDIDKNLKTLYLVSPRDLVFHCRKASIAKLFYPFLRGWLDASYPGLLDPGDASQMMSEEGLRVLLSYFIARTTAHYVPISGSILPQSYQYIISLDGYMESPFGAPGLPDELIKDIKKMMPTQKVVIGKEKPAASTATVESVKPSTVISDPALLEIVMNRVKNNVQPFYGHDVITDTDIKDPITKFVAVSWTAFIACMEQFKMGATIFLAPNEVVLDDVGQILFTENDFPILHYHGPDFDLAYKRNGLDVLYRGSKIDVNALANLREFFRRMFEVKVHSVTSLSETASVQAEILRSRGE